MRKLQGNGWQNRFFNIGWQVGFVTIGWQEGICIMVTTKTNTNEQRNSHKLWLQFGIRIRYQIIKEKLCFFAPATGPPTGVARQATSAIVANIRQHNTYTSPPIN